MKKTFCLLLAVTLAGPVSADDFWVLGRFNAETAARASGVAITTASGVEVLLHENDGYLLLTDTRVGQSALPKLAEAGIIDPPVLSIESPVPYMEILFEEVSVDLDLAAIDALLSDLGDATGDSVLPGGPNETYLVAGVFSREENARSMADRLSELGVTTRQASVGGQWLHRVLVGPLSEAEIEPMKLDLAGRGIVEAWRLQLAVPRVAVEPVVNDQQPDAQTTRVLQRSPGQEMKIEYESDFNLARLKRKPFDRKTK